MSPCAIFGLPIPHDPRFPPSDYFTCPSSMPFMHRPPAAARETKCLEICSVNVKHVKHVAPVLTVTCL